MGIKRGQRRIKEVNLGLGSIFCVSRQQYFQRKTAPMYSLLCAFILVLSFLHVFICHIAFRPSLICFILIRILFTDFPFLAIFLYRNGPLLPR